MPWIGSNRFLAVETPLGADVLLLREFIGHEGISQLFHFELDLLSEDAGIAFDSIVGQNVTFGVRLANGTDMRYFNGFVSRFTVLPNDERLARYRAEVVPWLWFLTRAADCRIFQQMTALDIVKAVFRNYGFQDFEDQTTGSFQTRDYCVQYRETAFNFVSRLLEEEGVYYFFKHENGKHTLVLANSTSAHKPCPETPKARVEEIRGAGTWRNEDFLTHWSLHHELRTGKYALNDYNFETPRTRLDANVSSTVSEGGNSRFEVFDYPGNYTTKGDGSTLARVRIEEEDASHAVAAGEGTCRGFVSGFKFDLEGHQRASMNGSYVLTAISHHGREGGFFTRQGEKVEPSYNNRFTAIPFAVPFRPPRLTRKPVVYGTQSAVVTGPAGEEIYTDKYGRVKVQFYWDRRGSYNDSSSCWVRVSQPWAGNGWGGIWLPRIGQEVVVDFLEGDPDRPLVVGRVYNAASMPPYALPANATRSTMKSNSSKGGGGFNEIRFEDKKGSEQIFVHGEKNLDVRIKNDTFQFVGHEAHLIVAADQFEQVKKNKHLTVAGDQNEKIGGTVSLNAGQNLQQKVGQKYALQAGMEVHIKAGMNLVIESGTTLTLKVGGNFVNINSGGIFIKGSMVMINSGGAAGSGAGCSPTTPTVPKEADTATAGKAETASTPATAPTQATFNAPMTSLHAAANQAQALQAASDNGNALCPVGCGCPYCNAE